MIAMVSSIPILQSSSVEANLFQVAPACNMNATLCRSSLPAVALMAALILVSVAVVDVIADEPAQPNGHRAADTVKFIAGAAEAFAEHEADHLLFDVLFDAHPYVKEVHFGPVPFFAIAHRAGLSPRREFVV